MWRRSRTNSADNTMANQECFARGYAETVGSANPAFARAAAFRSLVNENTPAFAPMFAESVSKSEIAEKKRKRP